MIFLRHSEKFPTSVTHCERDLIISTLYFLLAVIQAASTCLIASSSKLSGFNSSGFFPYHCYSSFLEDPLLLFLCCLAVLAGLCFFSSLS